MSLEDLRDNYKELRQSSDMKLKLNGSTCRRIRNLGIKKLGNLIVRKEIGNIDTNNELDHINNKYNLIEADREYSLNKNKRWELGGELKDKLIEFNEDDIDVRLYETRNLLQKRGNLVAIYKSKGDKIVMKHTYANLDSIQRKEFLDNMETKNPKEKVKKINRFKAKQVGHIETECPIRKSDDEEGNVQYYIDHAPQKDTLKYLKYEKNKMKVSKKKNFSDKYSKEADEFLISLSDMEDIENNKTEMNNLKRHSNIELNLDDLIFESQLSSTLASSIKVF